MTNNDRPKVLLVNDDPATLFTLRTLLSGLDAELTVASSGAEALRHLLARDFVVIVLDVKMPDMDGFDTARLIRQRPRSRYTPIIFLTSHRATDLDLAEGYALGAADYLFMPVSPEVLRAKIQVFVDLARHHGGQDQRQDVLAERNRQLQQQVEDLSRLNEALRAELESTQRGSEVGALERMTERAPGDLVAVLDHRGRWLYASPSYRALLGRPAPAADEDLLELVHPDDQLRVRSALDRALEEGEGMRLQYRLRLPDGSAHFLETTCSAIVDEDGQVSQVVLVAQDITERKEMEAHVLHMAYHDALTGLPNRQLLRDRMRQALAHQQRQNAQAAVLFVDLDRFKDVNDTLGHDVGDRLLQEVAERLQSCVRDSDTVARLGGDEFVLLLEAVGDPQQAAWVADKIVDEVSQPVRVGGQEIRVSPSVGIAIYPQDGSNIDALMRNADMAMQHAKQEGRGRFSFFTPEMNALAARRLAVGSAMQRALQQREFVLHYQPKVRLDSCEISGFEALIRWPQRDGSVISPAEFIPIAEETGRIAAVGDWALAAACEEMRRWRERDLPSRPVAVNLSARHFRRAGLVESIEDTLRETGVPAAALEAELTESAVMADPRAAVQTLGAMRELGMSIAIDDFGTGYSSLAYLKRFPIDKLKIDAAFVRDIPTDPDDAAIATAIISLAHSLGITVIAEGVETREQLEFLSRHGCDEVQGYFFSPAVPAQQAQALLVQGRIVH